MFIVSGTVESLSVGSGKTLYKTSHNRIAENVCHLTTFHSFTCVENSPLPVQSCYRWQQRWHRMHCGEKEQVLPQDTHLMSTTRFRLRSALSHSLTAESGPSSAKHDLRLYWQRDRMFRLSQILFQRMRWTDLRVVFQNKQAKKKLVLFLVHLLGNIRGEHVQKLQRSTVQWY